MKARANIKFWATVLYIIGAVAILVSYKNGQVPAPEWVFDLLSVGSFLCFLASYLCVIAAFPKSWLFVVSGAVLYCFGFDMVSELTGMNQGSIGKTFFWVTGLATTLTIHYGIKHNDD